MGTSTSPARTFTTNKLFKRHLTSDNMLRLASLFLLVSAWCLTSEGVSAQCNRELQKDTDFSWWDNIDRTFAGNPTECQAACTKYETCQFFTFVPKSNDCYLKASESGKPNRVRTNPIGVSGFSLRGCGTNQDHQGPPRTTPGTTPGTTKSQPRDHQGPSGTTPVTPQCRELQKDTDFWGENIDKTEAGNPTQCQEACTKHEACQFFTFVPRRNDCWLKASKSGKPGPVRKNRIPLALALVSGFSLRGCGQ